MRTKHSSLTFKFSIQDNTVDVHVLFCFILSSLTCFSLVFLSTMYDNSNVRLCRHFDSNNHCFLSHIICCLYLCVHFALIYTLGIRETEFIRFRNDCNGSMGISHMSIAWFAQKKKEKENVIGNCMSIS
jgi:hypothetical protein